jgi:allophanate hydrolase subunit 1
VYGVRLEQTVSLDQHFTKQLLMLSDTLMKYSIMFFVNLAPAEKNLTIFFAKQCNSTHTAEETI